MAEPDVIHVTIRGTRTMMSENALLDDVTVATAQKHITDMCEWIVRSAGPSVRVGGTQLPSGAFEASGAPGANEPRVAAAWLRQHLTPALALRCNLPWVGDFEAHIRTMYQRVADGPAVDPRFGLVALFHCAALVLDPEMASKRSGSSTMRHVTLTFDEAPHADVLRVVMHMARPHPLRRSVRGEPLPPPLTGVDMDVLRNVMWCDTDTDTYSGLLVLIVCTDHGMAGHVYPVDPAPDEFRMNGMFLEMTRDSTSRAPVRAAHILSTRLPPGAFAPHSPHAQLGASVHWGPWRQLRQSRPAADDGACGDHATTAASGDQPTPSTTADATTADATTADATTADATTADPTAAAAAAAGSVTDP